MDTVENEQVRGMGTVPVRLPEREVQALYLERTCTELSQLREAGIATAGNAFARVLLVKGRPGPAERGGAGLLTGADGDALRAALARLGWPDDAWGGLATFRADGSQLDATQVAWAVEVFDPECAVALDSPAARALEAAWDLGEPLPVGAVARVRGRRVLALGGFEAALASPEGKKEMWARLRQVPPLGNPLG